MLTSDRRNTEAGPAPAEGVDETVAKLGRRIRDLRNERLMTIQVLADKTGLSSSMLSLVERGKASPSIGTLVAIAAALGVHTVDLLNEPAPAASEPVMRVEEQAVFVTGTGVERRVLRADHPRAMEIVMATFAPGTCSTGAPTHHPGFEYGLIIEGNLQVEVAGEVYRLVPGDCISYDSTIPHRLFNEGKRSARAVWINVGR